MLPKAKQAGAVTTLLGNLLQCSTNLWVKNIFPYVQFKPSTTQLHAISQSPVTGHVSEEMGTFFSLHEDVEGHKGISHGKQKK